MNYEARIKELQLQLPPVSAPKGLYRPLVVSGNLAYLSGHVSATSDGTLIKGKVGEELDLEAGKLAARAAGLAILATLRHELGSLDKIKRVVKLFGMVNATPDFDKHPYVINGCSQLMEEVFGAENGVGARSAFGVSGLPGNSAVEIEAIFELND
ncbi:MAG: RidA family protein [Prolixibacteraceae bacterium]|jgi:enamine deaminase RidA (YjgF/YER057c/UK114 family)|nr:RidA family protein [Prolixibacteraceae bacterium]